MDDDSTGSAGDDAAGQGWSERISRVRERLHLTQAGLAAVLRVSTLTINSWEHGRRAGAGRNRHDASFHEELVGLLERVLDDHDPGTVLSTMHGASGHIDLALRLQALASSIEVTQPDIPIPKR